MSRIKTVYIAGPYSGQDKTGNVVKAIQTAEAVARMGLFPFCPHLFHYWNSLFPHRYEFWMNMDAVWITKCDAFLVYDESPGALQELDIAMQMDKPVFKSVAELAKEVLHQHNLDFPAE